MQPGRDRRGDKSSRRSVRRSREMCPRLIAAARGHARVAARTRSLRSRTLRASCGRIRREQGAENRSECDPRSTPSSKRNGHQLTPNGRRPPRDHRTSVAPYHTRIGAVPIPDNGKRRPPPLPYDAALDLVRSKSARVSDAARHPRVIGDRTARTHRIGGIGTSVSLPSADVDSGLNLRGIAGGVDGARRGRLDLRRQL